MESRRISDVVIKRLPRYYRFLTDLEIDKVERISSEELSRLMGYTASQIRQDFNNFGGFGQQGYGYNVSYLRNEIAKILGLDVEHNVVIIGGGNLGKALAGYERFALRGFIFKALFDVDPEVIGKKANGIDILSMDELEAYVKNNNIAMAALAVPRGAAVEVSHKLYDYGIRAFWNFAHTDLHLPDDAYVENVHLSESLMTLSYRLTQGK